MRKKIFIMLIAVIMIISITACAKENGEGEVVETDRPAQVETDSPSTTETKVELVLGGVTSDGAKEAVVLFAEKV